MSIRITMQLHVAIWGVRQAAKAADFYGCILGHVVESAVGEQAYVQAEMKDAPT